MDIGELCGIIEAILFVAGEPVRVDNLAHALNLTALELEPAIEQLRANCVLDRRGIRLNRHGMEIQLSINPEYSSYVESLLQPAQKQSLSQAVMETLSIIAYRQPVAKSDIEAIRGVKCDYSVQLLLSRGLIEEAGRRETLGRPILYQTTDKFLMHFGLEGLSQLPEAPLSAPETANEPMDAPDATNTLDAMDGSGTLELSNAPNANELTDAPDELTDAANELTDAPDELTDAANELTDAADGSDMPQSPDLLDMAAEPTGFVKEDN